MSLFDLRTLARRLWQAWTGHYNHHGERRAIEWGTRAERIAYVFRMWWRRRKPRPIDALNDLITDAILGADLDPV